MIEDILMSQKLLFESGYTLDVKNRLKHIKKLREVIIKYELEIKEALYMDLNKSYTESYLTEIGIVLKEINLFIKKINKWQKIKKVKTSIQSFPSKGYLKYKPYGQTLILSPWNYPFQLALVPLIGSIMAGNTVILKPSFDETKNVSLIIEKILAEAFESNYVYVYNKPLTEIDKLTDLRFDYIFFTGSSHVGKIIMEKASKYLTPVTLELGGKSPVILDENINLDLAVKRIAFGKMINSGQTCVAPDFIFIKENQIESFKELFKKHIESFFGDNPTSNKDYVKIINQKHYDRLISLLEGNEFETIGKHSIDKIAPTLVINPSKDSNIMKQEIFGPLMPLITYENIDEIHDYLYKNEKPLACYIFSNNKKFIKSILNNHNFGGVTINDTIMHFSEERLGFGGVGNSGMGKYHGYYSYKLFSHEMGILNRKNYLDINLRYHPYANKKESIIKKILK